MHKTLTPIRKHLFLFAALACAFCALPKASQGSPQNHSQNILLPEESPINKTQIVGCANFGQVQCDSANGGGISGYADATNLFQCLNTGNIAGERKIGGIAGYASGNSRDSGEIGHCFNSGLIHASNSSGGLIGYSGENIILTNTYNIGNVVASQFKGAIVGRKFHSNTRISNCYYDKQSCIPGAVEGSDIVSAAEGRFTRQMTGDSLQPMLGNAFWHFHADRYPTPQQWDSLPVVIGATSPVLFYGNQRLDSVADRFSLYSPQGMYWRSDDSSSVRITGNEGMILRSDSNRMVYIGDGTGIFRQVPLLYTYRSVCHKVAFHANLGSGQMDTMEVCGNQPAILPAPLFSRNHYLFQGWAYSGNGEVVLQSGDTLFCTQDTTLYAVWSPDGSDSSHAIPINNHLELMAFRDAVNNYSKGVFKGVRNQSTGFRDIHFVLTTDMDLDSLRASGSDWEPVGKSSSASFRGQFHGMGHRISHLYINTPAANYKGLFGYLDSALVEEVTLSPNDTIIGKQYCGGIAAFANNGSRILRCASHAYVAGESSHVGGICGNLAKSDMMDCYNTGSVTGTEKVGGLAGYTNGNSARYSHILRGFNSGQITATKAAGGICGNSHSYTEIKQVYHNGQVWADTLLGSLVGLKSQKSVSFQHAYYDIQISPVGAINGTDDSSAAGCATAALADSMPYGFDTRYWQQRQGNYPLLASAVTDTAARMAATPIRLAQRENINLISSDFTLDGCDWIQWNVTPATHLQINQCTAHITGSDSGIVLTAAYRQTFHRQIRIVRLQMRTRCNIRLCANDSGNLHIVLQAYKDSYLKLDTLPFQKAHQILRGWSFLPQESAMLAIGDSILVRQDTSLYAIWSNDGLSSEYALRIDNLNDWMAFRDAVNDYANGCYQGIYNRNNGYCGIHFALYAPIDLRTVCDSTHAWTPVGRSSSTPFRGNLEGNGHTIDYMIIDSAGMDFAGLFGCLDSATVSGIEVGNHSRLSGRRYIGGITGCARNGSNIRQCANHAAITGGEEYIGGICGYLSQSAIRECYNAADIRGTEKVGGIVGYAGTTSANSGSSEHRRSNVSYCYNSNAIYGTNCTGGLIGFLNGNSILENGYNSGQLSGQQYTGSIVGRKYSSIPVIKFCFYDRQISPVGGINGKDAATAEGRFTRQMTGNGLYSNLDSICWKYAENFYPRLNLIDNTTAAWISAIPIFLTEPESADSLLHDFLLGSWESSVWISTDSNKLRVEGHHASVTNSDSAVYLKLIYKGETYKRIRLHPVGQSDVIDEHYQKEKIDFRVYPNPTAEQLHIKTPEKFHFQQVCLYDASGKQLFRQTMETNQFHLDLSGLPAGIYRVILLGKDHKKYPFTIFKQ